MLKSEGRELRLLLLLAVPPVVEPEDDVEVDEEVEEARLLAESLAEKSCKTWSHITHVTASRARLMIF